MLQKNDGITNTRNDNDPELSHSGRLAYRQVGNIQLARGNKFVISLDEHRLPEGTRALYVRETE